MRADGGRFALRGELSFSNVRALYEQTEALLREPGSVTVDLAGIRRSDSAGVALLVEWMRRLRAQGREIRYLNIPPQMLALVRVSSLDQILPFSRA